MPRERVRLRAGPMTPHAHRVGPVPSPRPPRPWWLPIGAVLVLGVGIVATSQLWAAGPGLTAAGGPSPSPAAVAMLAPSAGPIASPVADPSVIPTIPPGFPTGYIWPLDHARITSWFGPLPNQPYLVDGQSFHDGIDIASFCGDHVTAAHDGTVLAAGRDTDAWYGWAASYAAHQAVIAAKHLLSTLAIEVITDDGNGYRSVYMHLGKALVKPGQQIRAGQLIGYEGKTGNATGCHLHFSIFSPTEIAVFQTAPSAIKRWTLPEAEIARIDPLLVLPPMASADVTWGWGARD